MHPDFPFSIGADGRTRAAPGDDKHLRDMIALLLFTQPGERVMRPDFGTGLLQYVFGPNRPELSATLQATIQGALMQWLGDVIEVAGVRVETDEGALHVTVVYTPRMGGQERSETFSRSST